MASASFADEAGDAKRGKELVGKYQCNRCHDGTGVESGVKPLEHCVHCHQDILAGKFRAPPDKLETWTKNLATLREVPSLSAAGKRFRRGWIATFLREPHDLRPRLLGSMPRFAISADDARDIAAYLVPNDPEPELAMSGADAVKGRALVEANGCGTCHVMTGAPPLPDAPTPLGPKDFETRPAVALAPDLRFARDRWRAAELVKWLREPRAVKADALMPQVPLTPEQARDIAAYLLTTPLAPAPPRAVPARLPVLERRVTWDEVYDRVFRKTCRHCHAEPDYALGDGGPGNTGGFGFAPRKLNLADYAGAQAGALDSSGQRKSVFAPLADGTPWLVASLLARQAEEAGKPNPEVRGMPLGLPSVAPEDIQLVETWVAQGRPQ